MGVAVNSGRVGQASDAGALELRHRVRPAAWSVVLAERSQGSERPGQRQGQRPGLRCASGGPPPGNSSTNHRQRERKRQREGGQVQGKTRAGEEGPPRTALCFINGVLPPSLPGAEAPSSAARGGARPLLALGKRFEKTGAELEKSGEALGMEGAAGANTAEFDDQRAHHGGEEGHHLVLDPEGGGHGRHR